MRRLTIALVVVIVALAAAAISFAADPDDWVEGGPDHSPEAAIAAARIPGPNAERAVVWAVGDAATPSSGADRLAALIRRVKPQLFLYLGDVYETGTREEFRQQYHPRFGWLAGITMPTIGNHEYDNRFSGFYPYWAARKGHRQSPWSKRTIAGWQILDLNSQARHGPKSAQVRWLEKTLKGAQGDCRLAFWHRPRFTHAGYEGAPDLNPLWHRLVGHARIVLSGHDHDLQRHRPVRGLIQYVVGAGGRSRYQLKPGDPTRAWGRDDVNGALRMVLKPGSALLEFRSARNRLLDRSRVSCSPAGH